MEFFFDCFCKSIIDAQLLAEHGFLSTYNVIRTTTEIQARLLLSEHMLGVYFGLDALRGMRYNVNSSLLEDGCTIVVGESLLNHELPSESCDNAFFQ